MLTKFAIGIIGSIGVSCATCPTPTTPTPKPWAVLAEKCELDKNLVRCDADAFHRAGLQSLDLARRLDLCNAEIESYRSLDVVNRDDVRACQDALDSASRYKWIYGSIGLALGLVLGAGMTYGLAR
jgi:hypothetical protein